MIEKYVHALRDPAARSPIHFYEHDKPEKLYANVGLDAKGIVKKVLDTLGQGEIAEVERKASA